MVFIKRKVIQIANSTQLISLPRKWTQKYNIKKGDELDIEESGNKIVVSAESSQSGKEITVDVNGLTPRLVLRLIAKVYQKGYDVVRINYSDPEVAFALQNKVKELLGFEILEQGKDVIVIKSISDKLDINFESSLRRAFLNVLEMSEDCLNGYKKKDVKVLENLYHKDYEVNKFCYFCQRSIRKGHQGSFGNYILYYLIESLEDVGDEYKSLAKHLARLEKKKTMVQILTKINNLTKIGYDFFYNPKKETAVAASDLYAECIKEIKQNMKTDDYEEIVALNSLFLIARLMNLFPGMRLDSIKEVEG